VSSKFEPELKQLLEYITQAKSESGGNHLVFPIFKKLFPGAQFQRETDAGGADIYIEGKLLVELKMDLKDVIAGFYQALHYEKAGLTFGSICVIAHEFIMLWVVDRIPNECKRFVALADARKSASETGIVNARKTSKLLRNEILTSHRFKIDSVDIQGLFHHNPLTPLIEFANVLFNLGSARSQINHINFIDRIKSMERFFENPIDAIHCFYAIVGYWDVTSTASRIGESNRITVLGHKGYKSSEPVPVKPEMVDECIKYINEHFVFTNEGSGLRTDDYFSRLDEVIARLDPEYTRQHGIYFTDVNLSKFALWFVKTNFDSKLSDKYIVIDPAGGSGNLVMSWQEHLKHKVVSELQEDLLKFIERRMKLDPYHIETGFTIVPKTEDNKGLNFLDKSAESYLYELMKELKDKNQKFDKPLAFLLNPPYKNTDENVGTRREKKAEYPIDPQIIELTGNDAGKERYLAFLGQILNICRLQTGDLKVGQSGLKFEDVKLDTTLNKDKDRPLLMIFTPTSWLIPRETYRKFREVFDKYFVFENGFIFLGKEFFAIEGSFPIAFTIWRYKHDPKGNDNQVVVKDLTHLKHEDLAKVNWGDTAENISELMSKHVDNAKGIDFSKRQQTIYQWLNQSRFDFVKDPTLKDLSSGIYGGLPLNAEQRKNKKTYGSRDGAYIGFMDDNSPVRVKGDVSKRLTQCPDTVWFRLDRDLQSLNLCRIISGPPDQKGYAAHDIEIAQKCFAWYSTAKVLLGNYPLWANTSHLWKPEIPPELERTFFGLCFAFGLAENYCVVTKFEKDNPVKDAPEVFVDNPLCPTNPESFWSTTLNSEIDDENPLAMSLVNAVTGLYRHWNKEHCQGQWLLNVGLKEEPYFKYFSYPDFLTPYSGLVQIRKYAEKHNKADLAERFELISKLSKRVKEEIRRMLIEEFKYFG
jgi:hypothetical protein